MSPEDILDECLTTLTPKTLRGFKTESEVNSFYSKILRTRGIAKKLALKTSLPYAYEHITVSKNLDDLSITAHPPLNLTMEDG